MTFGEFKMIIVRANKLPICETCGRLIHQNQEYKSSRRGRYGSKFRHSACLERLLQ